jgi:hypothetical protein
MIAGHHGLVRIFNLDAVLRKVTEAGGAANH